MTGAAPPPVTARSPGPGAPLRRLGLALLLVVACRYNPSFSNTRCATGEPRCPSGYVCDATMTPAFCVSLTENQASGGRGGTPAAGSGGTGGVSVGNPGEAGAGGRTGSGGVGAGGGGRSADAGTGGGAGTSGPIGSGGAMASGGQSGAGGKAAGGMPGSGGGPAASGGLTGSGGISGSGGVAGHPGSGGVGSGGLGSGGAATGGTTVPECGATDTRCVSSTDVQSCNAGHWDAIATCANACVGQTCGGECVPARKRCSSDTPQSCDQTGTWKDAATGACPAGLCASGACLTITNIGFTTGSAESLAPANNLVGVQVQLPAGVLVGLGLIATQTTGQHLIFGLYTDVSGSPGKLIQSSGQLTVAVGTNEVSLTHTTIAAGAYWIVEVSDGTTHFASPGQSITVAVSSFTFGPLPMNIVGGLPTATGNAPDLYARVAN